MDVFDFAGMSQDEQGGPVGGLLQSLLLNKPGTQAQRAARPPSNALKAGTTAATTSGSRTNQQPVAKTFQRGSQARPAPPAATSTTAARNKHQTDSRSSNLLLLPLPLPLPSTAAAALQDPAAAARKVAGSSAGDLSAFDFCLPSLQQQQQQQQQQRKPAGSFRTAGRAGGTSQPQQQEQLKRPGQTVKQVIAPKQNIYVKGYPRNWGKADLIKQVLLTSNVTLRDNLIISRFTMKYSGSVNHPYMTQEVPAVFVDRRFSVLAYYAGSKPWTSDPNVTFAFPPGRNVYARPTEHWAAFIDPLTGWGVGVFNPMAWMGITAYRVGQDGSDKPWDCSYFAHTIRMQLHKGMSPYSYNVGITVDKLSHIRATFAKLRSTPGFMPVNSKSDTPPPPLNPTDFLAQGQPDLGRNSQFGRQLNCSSFSNVDLAAAAAAAVQAAAASSGGGSTTGTGAAGPAAGKAGLGGTAAGAPDAGDLGAARVRPGRHSGPAGGLLAGVLVAGVTVGGAMLAAIGVAASHKRRQRAAAAGTATEEGTAAEAAGGTEAGAESLAAVITPNTGSHVRAEQVPCSIEEATLTTSEADGEPAAAAVGVSAADDLALGKEAASPALVATPTAAASPGVTTRAAAALLRRAQQQPQQP